MRKIDRSGYGPLTLELLALAETANLPATLQFGTRFEAAVPKLQQMTAQNISTNRRVRMPHDADALRAGLWLLFDCMTESHDISQNIATPSGSYWHGILHRREPDEMNACYWFARAGEHPVFVELLNDARELAELLYPDSAAAAALKGMSRWDARWFANQCCAEKPACEVLLLGLQRREWELLFDYNYRKAFA